MQSGQTLEEKANSFIMQSRECLAKKEFNQAHNLVMKALRFAEEKKTYAKAYNLRGIINRNQSQFDSAISDYTQAIKYNPISEYYYNRGLAYAYKGDLATALQDYHETEKINMREGKTLDPDLYFVRAEAYQRKGLYEQALEDYKKCDDDGSLEEYKKLKQELAQRLQLVRELVSKVYFWERKIGNEYIKQVYDLSNDPERSDASTMTIITQLAKRILESRFKVALSFTVIQFFSAIVNNSDSALMSLRDRAKDLPRKAQLIRKEIKAISRELKIIKKFERISEIISDTLFWENKSGNNFIKRAFKILHSNKDISLADKLKRVADLAKDYSQPSFFKPKFDEMIDKLLFAIETDSDTMFNEIKKDMHAGMRVIEIDNPNKKIFKGIGSNAL